MVVPKGGQIRPWFPLEGYMGEIGSGANVGMWGVINPESGHHLQSGLAGQCFFRTPVMLALPAGRLFYG